MNWQPLEGTKPQDDAPYGSSAHPSEPFVCLQVAVWKGCSRDRATVLNRETGRVWSPPGDAVALAFSFDGKAIYAVRETYVHDPSAHDVFVSPLQSEFRYSLERWAWPPADPSLPAKPEASGDLELPTGWPVRVIVSPSLPLLAVQWVDQSESGIELVADFGARLGQIEGEGLEIENDIMMDVAFSEDGAAVGALLCRSSIEPDNAPRVASFVHRDVELESPWLTTPIRVPGLSHDEYDVYAGVSRILAFPNGGEARVRLPGGKEQPLELATEPTEAYDVSPANLQGAALAGKDLPDVKCGDFTRADLTGARLHGSYQRADFREANLTGADLEMGDLSHADLRGASLPGANLKGVQLRGARLEGLELSGLDLEGATLADASAEGIVLAGANLAEASARRVKLRRADLSGARLAGAFLDDADLEGANLRGADLSGARLARANLSAADLTDARLDGADFAGARRDGARGLPEPR
jgi:uncharacterized protein YjbI with pentapeptide repeats